jgi:lysophospholipase L1-like esterase
MVGSSKKNLFTVFTILMSMGVLIVLGEVGIRLFVKNGDITPEILRNRSVQYEPVVFARHAFKQEARLIEHTFGSKEGLVWEINDQGYRGQNFEIQKADGTTRIIIYGGSAVFDTKSTKGEDWPHRVQGKLRGAGFPNVEVINAGIIAHTALESVGRLFTEGYAFEPDYVLIYHAWNDIKYFSSHKTALRTLLPSLQGFDPRIHYGNIIDRWLCEWSQLYTVLRRTYYKTKLKIGKEGMRKAGNLRNSIDILNPNGFRQYQLAMEVFVDLARNIGAEPILMTQARLVSGSKVLTPEQQKRVDYHHVGLSHEALVETFDRLDAIVRKVSAEKGTILIDASAHLSGKDWAFDDHVHVVPKGSDALAQLVADYFQVILEKGGEKFDRE